MMAFNTVVLRHFQHSQTACSRTECWLPPFLHCSEARFFFFLWLAREEHPRPYPRVERVEYEMTLYVLRSDAKRLTSSSAKTDRLKKAPRKDSLCTSRPVPGLRGSGHHRGMEVIWAGRERGVISLCQQRQDSCSTSRPHGWEGRYFTVKNKQPLTSHTLSRCIIACASPLDGWHCSNWVG